MSKPKEIQVTVQHPCTKKEWDDMTPNAIGRHCDNCGFTVVDFSNFTDKESVNFLLKSKDQHLCGRFNSYQLNRPILLPASNNNSIFSKILFSTALLAGVAAKASGLGTIAPEIRSQVPLHNTIVNPNKVTINKQAKDQLQVKGKVTDKRTKEPISNAWVEIKGTSISTMTDSTEAYSLQIPDSMSGRKIILVFHKYWHKNRNYSLNTSNIPGSIDMGLVPKRGKRPQMVMGCPSF